MFSIPESQKKLFEEITKFYHDVFALPPLSAKIYATLVLDYGRNGLSFEEITAYTKSSKSSVSESLKLLTERGFISSKTKEHERKRHFFINENFFNLRFDSILKILKDEMNIIEQMIEFCPSDKLKLNERLLIYKEMLKNNAANIEETLEKLKNI